LQTTYPRLGFGVGAAKSNLHIFNRLQTWLIGLFG
jgi:hypothetical protein